MNELLLEPLKYYDSFAKNAISENAEQYFDELLKKSGVNEEENKATVKAHKEELQKFEKARKKLSSLKAWRIALIILAVLGGISCIIGILIPMILLAVLSALVPIAALVLIFVKINKSIKALTALCEELRAAAVKLFEEASAQMAPLNDLFDDTDTFRLIEKTMPEVAFTRHLEHDHRDLLRMEDDFNDSHNLDTSTINTVSGSIFKNPFTFCRQLVHEMGNHTYHGSLVISWSETYRDSQGKTRTRTRTQTLHASVTKPKPFYRTESRLCYTCEAAPRLSFSRTPTHAEDLSEKKLKRKIRAGKKELKKKAREALKNGESFQEMSNSDFDVLFGADDRDNEVEFRLMFTPLAQKNTMALMTDKDGYGDDFEFRKVKELNIIKSEHAQSWSMGTSASNYRSYDVDTARKNFKQFNSDYFRSVFFDFAPLIAIPAYTEEPMSASDLSEAKSSHLSIYEHEIMANALGASNFAHEDSRTSVILKTNCIESTDLTDVIEVSAFSYATFDRVDFVPVRGGDGRWHSVPVYWVEYIPISKTSLMEASPIDLSEKEFDDMKEKNSDTFKDEIFFNGMVAKKLSDRK